MSDDKLGFLDEEATDAPVDEPEQVEEPEAVEVTGQAEPEAEEVETAEAETGEEEAAPPVADPEEHKATVPVTALQEERTKRQALERELAELRQRAAQQQQPQQPQPDFYDNPDEAVRRQITDATLKQSHFFATKEFGNELVQETIAYFDQNPHLSQQFLNEPSPFHAAVEFYQRQKVADEIGSDPDAYKAKLREELLAELQAQQPAPKPQAPPPSMARAPSAGREAITPGTAFDMLLPD